MPTSTVTLNYTLANWGPAPTTWSMPDCTSTSSVYFATSSIPDAPRHLESCLPQSALGDCSPEPTNSAILDAYLKDMNQVPYWSGDRCPEGWKSIGEIIRSDDGPPASEGIFAGLSPSQTTQGALDDAALFETQHALGALLDPSETVLACCPEALTAGRAGLCFSTLPEQEISTECRAFYGTVNLLTVSTTFPVDGATYTGEVIVPPRDNPRTYASTRIDEIGEETAALLVAVTARPPVYLVHGGGNGGDEGEGDDGGSGGEDEQGGDGESEEGEQAEEPSNAAAALRITSYSTPWAQVQDVIGVLGVSFLAGMALSLPM
ncbi:hypothetical protein BJY04DRAFT_221202 [Aspergillus karnatakaensis]|uniref:uncharacterized protein n=1 Tax=Aspergillus karnatakaensis TaxID=1810916 RepID=UPI003CCE1BFB